MRLAKLVSVVMIAVVLLVAFPLAAFAGSVAVKQSYPTYTAEIKKTADPATQINVGGEAFRNGGESAFEWLRNMAYGFYPGDGVNPYQVKVWLTGVKNGEGRRIFAGYATYYKPLFPNSGSTQWNLVINKTLLDGVANPEFALQWHGDKYHYDPDRYLGAYTGGDVVANINYGP